MLREIQDDELQLLDDDPVRPSISVDEKMANGKVLVIENDGMVDAVICIKFTNKIVITYVRTYENLPFRNFLMSSTLLAKS